MAGETICDAEGIDIASVRNEYRWRTTAVWPFDRADYATDHLG